MSDSEPLAAAAEVSLAPAAPLVAEQSDSDMVAAPSATEPAAAVDPAPASSEVSMQPVQASAPDAAPVQAAEPIEQPAPAPAAPAPSQPPPQQLHAPQLHAPQAQAAVKQAALLATSTPSSSQVSTPQPAPQAIPKATQLKQRVQANPEDVDAWREMIKEAERKGDLERTREIYEEVLKHFPDAGKIWVAYADLELRHGLFPRVEGIFARCLRNSTSVDIWAFYITYIRRMNPVEGVHADKAKNSRITISKSYEFALLHVGQDALAGGLWVDYIAFLKSSDSTGTWEAQQNMDNIRKAYQRAVSIPLENVEQIWSEYNHWEQSLSKLTAKKFIGERGAAYMTARAALRTLSTLKTGIMTGDDLPRRPDWSDPEDKARLDSWQRYFQWEEFNPLQLEDVNALQSRVLFAYRKSFAEARFYPPIWFLSSNYAASVGKVDDAVKFLEAGFTANPMSLLLAFALGEQQELRRNLPACYKIYDGLVQAHQKTFSDIESARDARIDYAIQQAKAVVAGSTRTTNGNAAGEDDEDESEATLAEEIVQIKDAITLETHVIIEELEKALASVWIAEMRFARRAEGIKQARTIFSKARKAPHLAWQVIEANAMMEFHWNKEPKVATNVFELGLKSFSENVDYVVRYLDFLINTNDDTNARAVFERTVSKVSEEAARPLWERWFRYESQYSDLSAIQKLDARVGETYPSNTPLQRFVGKAQLRWTELDEATRSRPRLRRCSSQ